MASAAAGATTVAGNLRTRSRTQFVDRRGIRLLAMDFSELADEGEVLRTILQAKNFVAAQPDKRHLLTLVKMAGTVFGPRGIAALKDLAKHNASRVIAGAVVGMTPVQRIMCRLVNTLTGRSLRGVETEAEAEEWLIQQKKSK